MNEKSVEDTQELIVIREVAADFEVIFDHLDAGNVAAAQDHAAYCAKYYRARSAE